MLNQAVLDTLTAFVSQFVLDGNFSSRLAMYRWRLFRIRFLSFCVICFNNCLCTTLWIYINKPKIMVRMKLFKCNPCEATRRDLLSSHNYEATLNKSVLTFWSVHLSSPRMRPNISMPSSRYWHSEKLKIKWYGSSNLEGFYTPLLKLKLALFCEFCEWANKQTRSAVQIQACLKKEISGATGKRGTKCCVAVAEQINAAPQFVDKSTEHSVGGHANAHLIHLVIGHHLGRLGRSSYPWMPWAESQDEQSAECGEQAARTHRLSHRKMWALSRRILQMTSK